MRTLAHIRTLFGALLAVAILGGGLYVVDQYMTGPSSVIYSVTWSHRPPANVHYTQPDGKVQSVSFAQLVGNNPQSANDGGAWSTSVPYVKAETYIINADTVDVATVLSITAGSHSATTHATHDGEHISAHMVAIW